MIVVVMDESVDVFLKGDDCGFDARLDRDRNDGMGFAAGGE